MPLTNDSLQEWLASLPKGTVVAIDDSGFYLETEGMHDYIEVGLFPTSDQASAPMASYFQPIPGRVYDVTFLSADQSTTYQAKQARFRRVLKNGRYYFVNKDQTFYIPPAHVLTCTESA
jgi:hypothetical protein